MASALDSALTAAGVTLADNSRANIVFESPVQAADLTLSAAYKHIADADRLTIETSDTTVGNISCTGTTSANSTASRNFANYSGTLTVAAGTATDTCTNAK